MTPRCRSSSVLWVAAITCGLAACTAAVKPEGAGGATGSLAQDRTAASIPGTPADGADRQRTLAKVALLLPLSGSGQAEPVAMAMRQAAELALFQAGGAAIQLVVKDDKGTPDGAKVAATEAIQEGAEVILGPLFAKSVTAAADVARVAKVPVVAFSSDRQAAGRGAWLLSFLPEQEVHRIIGYAAGQGKKRMASLVPGDAYGRLVEKAFREAAGKHGVQIVALETFQPGGNGLMTGVRALKDRLAEASAAGGGVDALFLPVAVEQLPQLSSLLPHMGLDLQAVQILGAGGWDAADFTNLPAFHGAWHAGSDPRGWREFAERFGKSYGLMPPRLAALGYDAVGVAASLASAPRGERYTPASLMRAGGFAGVDGQFRLLADGTSERSLAILEVGRNSPRVLEAASIGAGAVSARASASGSEVN